MAEEIVDDEPIRIQLDFIKDRDGLLYQEIKRYLSGSYKRNRATMLKNLLREFWMHDSRIEGSTTKSLSSSSRVVKHDRNQTKDYESQKQPATAQSNGVEKSIGKNSGSNGGNFMDEMKNDVLDFNFN